MNRRTNCPSNLPRTGVILGLVLLASSLRGASMTEIERIAALLELEPGHVVADVGAGDGDFSERLAEEVGPRGRVYATEVKQDLVKKIEKRMKRLGLSQVDAVLGNQDEIGLTADCCDAVLLRLVYHHFVKPQKMRSDLWRALKPNGLIAIVDITPQKHWSELPGVPNRGGHGIPTGDLVGEMLDAGFELVEQQSNWNGEEDRFAVLFRKPAN